jgi:hypothetical protein
LGTFVFSSLQRTQQYNDLLAALLSVLLDHTVVASEPARVYDRVISIVSAALGTHFV